MVLCRERRSRVARDTQMRGGGARTRCVSTGRVPPTCPSSPTVCNLLVEWGPGPRPAPAPSSQGSSLPLTLTDALGGLYTGTWRPASSFRLRRAPPPGRGGSARLRPCGAARARRQTSRPDPLRPRRVTGGSRRDWKPHRAEPRGRRAGPARGAGGDLAPLLPRRALGGASAATGVPVPQTSDGCRPPCGPRRPGAFDGQPYFCPRTPPGCPRVVPPCAELPLCA